MVSFFYNEIFELREHILCGAAFGYCHCLSLIAKYNFINMNNSGGSPKLICNPLCTRGIKYKILGAR